jgi:hypothetical protein
MLIMKIKIIEENNKINKKIKGIYIIMLILSKIQEIIQKNNMLLLKGKIY